MKYELHYAKDLHDREGDAYENGIVLFLGNGTMLLFDTADQLEEFANRILGMLPEIRES